mmetsp:Transcript_114503/g.363926  ORF Transcript_114503/g.363926 Transcript_114503/m.363926 type:complete len:162 (-) Transcript_114503:25-510(-)
MVDLRGPSGPPAAIAQPELTGHRLASGGGVVNGAESVVRPIADWMDAKKEGEGELIYSNGDRFKGQRLDDRASGWGVFVWANGNRYEGQWLYDSRHGRGQFVCSEDGSVYDGEFAFDRKEGRGLFKMSNGYVVSGVWKQGELSNVVEFSFGPDSHWQNANL